MTDKGSTFSMFSDVFKMFTNDKQRMGLVNDVTSVFSIRQVRISLLFLMLFNIKLPSNDSFSYPITLSNH